MARKIKLSENQLTQIIEKVMRERNITLKEDSEGKKLITMVKTRVVTERKKCQWKIE